MKKYIFVLIGLACSLSVFAQEKLYIHKSDNIAIGALISKTDSIYFNHDGSIVYFKVGDSIAQFAKSTIDSILFGNNDTTVYIKYNGTSVSVINPLAFEGVNVSVNGADVIVSQSGNVRDINYKLTGSTTDGMFKIYSDKRFIMSLNGVNITNANGPAINIQSNNKAFINLIDGTTNVLTDGTVYAPAATKTDGSAEDQNAAFFSEGKLEFIGTGNLTINGRGPDKHAICSDDAIDFTNGNITIVSAPKDGIHANDGMKISGGTLNVTSSGEAIDGGDSFVEITGGNITTNTIIADTKGIRCDSTIKISGGTLNINVGGVQSKGIKSGKDMMLTGGNININTTGGVALVTSGSGFNPAYCTAISSDSNIVIDGANIIITCSGIAGKGIMANGDVNIISGSVNVTTQGSGSTYTNSKGSTDSYSSTCIGSDDNINILGGNVTVQSSGTGGKGIVADDNLTFGSQSSNPVVTVTTTGSRLLVSGTGVTADYADPRAIKSNGILTVNNGTFTITTSQIGADGIVCDSFLYINGGTITETIGGAETKGIRGTQAMTFNGGTINITISGGVNMVASGSGYDPAYSAGIKGDANIYLNGSDITVISTGSVGKGITGAANINITAGTIKVTTSGVGKTYTNSTGATDSYSASGIITDGNLSITGGTITLSSSGAGGKGISVEGTLTIGDANGSPTINITTSGPKFVVSGTDYCHPKCIRTTGTVSINNGTTSVTSSDDGLHSDASITQNGGNFTVTSSVEGVESKFITINGGTMTVTASNDGLNLTYSTVSGGTEQNDGSCLYVNGGTVISSCTNGDAIDSNGNITISGGTVVANGPQSGVEEACDFNGTFNMNGGFFIGAGSSSNMTKAMSASSTQRNMFISSSSVISSGTLFHIQNASGTDIVTFKPQYGGYKFLFSSSALTAGASYSIYTGGSYTGGTSNNGLYSGGSYSSTEATLKKTVTLSSSGTVNSISF